MANQQQDLIDVGLNLSGNALGSITQLTQKMLSLRDAAAGVGAVIKAVNADIKKLDASTGTKNTALNPTMLKKLKQQVDMLTMTPDMVQRQAYSRLNQAALANQFKQLMASGRQFSNPNTMQSLFQEYDPKVIKSVLDTQLNTARLQGDTKKAQEAIRALDQYQKTMLELNTKLKGMATLKRLQDQATIDFLNQPLSEQAIKTATAGRLNRNYITAADEKAIRQYMANPKTLKPSTDPLTGGSTRPALAENTQKIAAAQRLMAQKYLEPDSATRTKELAAISKILDSLEAERIKLQAVSNIKRANLKQTDDELRNLKKITDEQQRQLKLQETLKGSLNTKTLSADRIAQLSPEDLVARQVTMTKRLSQAKSALFEAERLGNVQAQKDAKDMVFRYQQEVDAIKARTRAVKEYHKEEKSEAEISGMRLANRMSFLRDFAMLGAGIGAITGSYQFLRDYENALKQTQAIAQATDTQMASLSSSILKVAENSRFSAIEITDAATTLAQAGFSMSEIEKTLESVTLLATATGSTLKETVDIATASLGAFQLSAENMPTIVNQITQAMNLSKLDIQKFQLAVQYAGNAASDAGLDFEELLSSVATVANAGVRSGSTLGTGFRQLLSDLLAPSQKFVDILTRLGLSAADVDVRTKGLVGALKTLREAGFTTADAYQSFEVRSVAFYTALSNNLEMYNDLSANLDNNTAAMDANEIQMNSLAAQTDRMTNQFKALAEVSGAGVRDVLTDIIHVIGDVLIGVRELTDNGFVRYTAQVVVMSAALTTGVLVLRSSVGAVAALIDIYKKAAIAQAGMTAATVATGTAATTTTGAVTGLRIAMMATLPQIMVITALVSGAVLAFKAFSDANADLKENVEETKTSVNNLNDSISNIQNEIQETDKKIVSLESRFESLKDDPAAVAIEMAKLKDRAAELGITLGTDLKNNIESVRLGWEELRLSLGKELVMNLDNQISELQNLAYLTAQLKSQELEDRGDMFSPTNMRKLGFDKAYSFNDLNKELKDEQTLTGKDAILAPKPKTNAVQFFTAIAEANKAGGGRGDAASIKALADGIIQSAKDLKDMSPEMAQKELPVILRNINTLNTIVNGARKQFQNKKNSGTDEQKKAASQTIDSINNFVREFSLYTNAINKFDSTLSQQRMTQNQRDVQVAENNVRSKVYDMRAGGNITGGMSSKQFGNMAKFATAKTKPLTIEQQRRLKEVMPLFEKASAATGVPVDLLVAQSITESSLGSSRVLGDTGKKDAKGNPIKTSAVGLMQVTRAAAQDVGFNYESIVGNDANNIMAGAKYIAQKYAEFGNWEDAFRAYYMGAGDLRTYKQGKGATGRYKESDQYVRKIASNYSQFSKTGGRSQVVGQIDIPENIQNDLNVLEQLRLLQENDANVLQSKYGNVDPNKLSPAEKRNFEELSNRVQGYQRVMDDLQNQTNNAIQSAQARDTEERKREREARDFNIKSIQAEIAKIEQVLKSEKSVTSAEDYKKNVEAVKLFDKLKELKEQEINMTADLTKFDAVTYSAENKVLGNYVAMSADLKLKTDTENMQLEISQRREKWLKDAANQYAELIKKQNKEFIDRINTSITEVNNKVNTAIQAIDFQKQIDTWALEDSTGLNDLKAQRALMDDPRFKDEYSDFQREETARKINETALEAFNQIQINDLENRKVTYLGAIKEISEVIEKAQVEQKKISEDLMVQAQSIGDEKIREAAVTELKNQQSKLTEDLVKKSAELNEWKEKIRDVEQKIKESSAEYKPSTMGIGETVRGIVNKNKRQMESENQTYADIQNVLGGVQTAFDQLITTAWEASDSFDDFFKILTGGSKESKDAFKAFGYSVMETMLKIVKDKITQQFMELLSLTLFGDSGEGGAVGIVQQGIGSGIAKVVNAASATRIGQKALNPEEGNDKYGWLRNVLQVGGQIASAYLGGGIGAAAAGTAGSVSSMDAITRTTATPSAGMNYNLPSGGSWGMYSQGGLVKGHGAPNVDTIPTLLSKDEYVLPENVTDTVGLGFLEKLRADPAGVVNSKYNVAINKPVQDKPPSMTNVYVVQDSNVPKSLTQNDVVVTVADNIVRNGQLKTLIKQIANG